MCRWLYSLLHSRKAKELPPPGAVDTQLPEFLNPSRSDKSLVLTGSEHLSAPILLPGAPVVELNVKKADSSQISPTHVDPSCEENSHGAVVEGEEKPISHIPIQLIEAVSSTAAPGDQQRNAPGSQTGRSRPPRSKAYIEGRVRYFSRPEDTLSSEENCLFLAPNLSTRLDPKLELWVDDFDR